MLLARAYVATTPGNALDQIVYAFVCMCCVCVCVCVCECVCGSCYLTSRFAAIVLLSVLMYCMEWSNPSMCVIVSSPFISYLPPCCLCSSPSLLPLLLPFPAASLPPLPCCLSTSPSLLPLLLPFSAASPHTPLSSSLP